ncbi:MAG: hypothetical protein ACK45I_03060 [Bacteroidota bacterium]|jgi:hypothetical protein
MKNSERLRAIYHMSLTIQNQSNACVAIMEEIKDAGAFDKVELEWGSSSPWANPHMNDLYTKNVKIVEEHGNGDYHNISFFVSKCHLIFRQESFWDNGSFVETEVAYFDMGEFRETVINGDAVESVKAYAQYVADSFIESGYSLRYCPSYERIDDVDDNFNEVNFNPS